MNLISGELMNHEQSLERLKYLNESICKTYSGNEITTDKIISACDELSGKLNEAEHLPLLLGLGMSKRKACEELVLVKQIMSRTYLEERIKIELGMDPEGQVQFIPYGGTNAVAQEWKPLGVLLHIAAGNVDALPVFSVIEGLLAGNINILKLPGADDGLSIAILQELIKIYPLIAEYVYVFDYPSEDIESIKLMADAADAIVVWGGDSVVKAVRGMAKQDTRIIEWGHKISFAYVSGRDIPDESLEGIAYNICDTNQMFCNSCQGIFLNTDDFGVVKQFAERFIKILDKVAGASPLADNPLLDAKKTLEICVEELESLKMSKKVFRTENCSIIASDDSLLEISYMFRNCWIKPLPQKNILFELLKYKNHLQTVALVCEEDNREILESLLLKTGIVRITSGQNMSKSYCGIPHDGEFPLNRYMKRVSFEY